MPKKSCEGVLGPAFALSYNSMVLILVDSDVTDVYALVRSRSEEFERKPQLCLH